jgi:hypothetical protein
MTFVEVAQILLQFVTETDRDCSHTHHTHTPRENQQYFIAKIYIDAKYPTFCSSFLSQNVVLCFSSSTTLTEISAHTHFPTIGMQRVCLSRTSLLLVGGVASLPLLCNKYKQYFTSHCDDKKVPNPTLDDCLNPACHSTMDLLKKFNMKKRVAPKAVKEPEEENPYCSGCPPDRDQLGRGTWDLIHTIAASYPEHPTPEQKKHTDMFLRSLSMVYPCPYCATHFQHTIEVSPPRYE